MAKFKNLLVLAAFVSLLAFPGWARGANNRADLILLMGQSNAQGNGTLFSELPADIPDTMAKLKIWNGVQFVDLSQNIAVTMGSEFGPEIGLADLLSRHANRAFYLVKATQGATGFATNDWNPGDPNYLDAVQKANAAVAALNGLGFDDISIYIVWAQGENDTFAYNLYEEREWNFFNGLQADLNGTVVKIIDALISKNQTTIGEIFRNGINNAKKNNAVKDNKIVIINTDSCATQTGDPVHFSAAGELDFGKKIGWAALFGNDFTGLTQFEISERGYLGLRNTNPQAFLDITAPAGENNYLRVLGSGVPEINGFFKILNGTGQAGAFTPAIHGRTNASGYPGFWFIGDTAYSADPAGTQTPIMRFSARVNNNIVRNRPIVAFDNYIDTKMLITAAGQVGVGTKTPTNLLHLYSSNDENVLRVQDSNGDCVLNPESGGGLSCTSDARLKKNIRDLEPSLEQVLALRPARFNLKTDGAEKIGFIAQEVGGVIPEAVDASQEYLHLNYNFFIPKIVKAVQEIWQSVQEQLTRLNDRQDQTADKIRELENKIRVLEQKCAD